MVYYAPQKPNSWLALSRNKKIIRIRRLIIFTEETGIYISTFANTLTSKMAKYHEIRICFFDKSGCSFMSRITITLKFERC